MMHVNNASVAWHPHRLPMSLQTTNLTEGDYQFKYQPRDWYPIFPKEATLNVKFIDKESISDEVDKAPDNSSDT